MATAPIPEPLDSDPSDVAVALEAGRALWDNGDTREALRWFSRAADAAEEAGDDLRALKIARAIAELRDELQIHSILPPPPSPATPKAAAPAPAPVETKPPATAAPAPTPSASAQSPEAEPSDRTALAPAPSQPKPAAQPSKQTDPTTLAEPAPDAKPPITAKTTRTKAQPAAGTTAEARPTAGATRTEPTATAPRIRATAAAAGRPAGDDGRSAAARGDGALHVAVKTSVRDPNLLLVRILPEGATAPPGTHEAFLTAADASIDLSRLAD